MKSKQETLFDHYQVGENSEPTLSDQNIFDAMQEYAREYLIEFEMQRIGPGASKFEIKRMIKEFDAKLRDHA
jgi:hypothetical protein